MQARWGTLATVQPPNTSQLIPQGIERYNKAGEVQGAITSWQTALTAYQSTNDRANEAIVREKLTIAYRQIGQFEQAINYWKEALTNLSKLGDFWRFPEGGTLAHRTCSNLQSIRAK